MGFLDNMKDLAESATKNANNMAKSATAKIENKKKINDLEKDKEKATMNIRRSYEKLGEMFVQEMNDDISMDQNLVAEELDLIKENKARISAVDIQIEEAKKDLEEKLDDIEREKY